MDKNTITGLVIIGLILTVFTVFNKPSEEELAKQEAQQTALIAEEKKKAEDKSEVKTEDKSTQSNNDQVADSNQTDEVNTDKNGKIITIENEKLVIELNTLGGQVASVRMKEFQTYKDFANKETPHKNLTFFKRGDATNGLKFELDKRNFNSADELFTLVSHTDNEATFRWKNENGQQIEFKYALNADKYDLDYDISVKGFDGKVSPNNFIFNWEASLQKTERLFAEQRRVSTVCYRYKNDGFSYLSEMGSENEPAEDAIEWVAFKQSYFSSFISSQNGFAKDGSEFDITTYEEGTKKDWTLLKDYSTKLNLNLNNSANSTVRLNWFFGPNDYKVLTSYYAGYDDVLNYGWGLFRWINLYAVQPVFNFLTSTGMGIGIAILFLTLLIKTVLMPIQWKMYTSSAKMRILKPEIEELAKKYPNKEDAMKKQMETMTLYRESGASPLAGCVPMLIQMPILLAVFRFFPATFDLRQKSFLWAEDLSSYDSILDFGFNIWPYGDHVSLFTLLMAATTLVYTVINSSNMQTPQQPGMPNMKYIMYFFPIMMIFFFNNYSSGLSYYYFISTLTSIVIMLLIKKFFVDEEKLKLKMANRKTQASSNPKKKGKSKFQERLELMQKKQQEQMKNRGNK